MKFLSLVVLALTLSACAPQQHQSTAWTMSWQCYNSYCCSHVGNGNACSGNGSFSSESDCVVWETAFLNSAAANHGGGVSSCTGN